MLQPYNFSNIFFSAVAHQGKRLQELVKLKKLTQKQITERMGYSDRASFIRYYDKEILPQVFITKAAAALGVEESAFNQDKSKEVSFEAGPVDASCWQLLAEARQHIIQLQQQLIEMSRPNLNAPVGKQAV